MAIRGGGRDGRRLDFCQPMRRDSTSAFFDDDLSDRIESALEDWCTEAAEAIEMHDGCDDAAAEIGAARDKLIAAVEELSNAQNAALARFADIAPPELDVEEPELDDEPDAGVIFTTKEDYVTASRRMIVTKRYLDYDPDDDDDFDQDEDE